MTTYAITITASDFKSFVSDFNDYLEAEGLEPVEVSRRSVAAFNCDEPLLTMMRLGMFLARFDTDDSIVAVFDRCAVSARSLGRRGTELYWPRLEVVG